MQLIELLKAFSKEMKAEGGLVGKRISLNGRETREATKYDQTRAYTHSVYTLACVIYANKNMKMGIQKPLNF